MARPDGTLVYVNAVGRALLGRTSENVRGTLTERFTDDERKKFVVETVLSEGTGEGEQCFRHQVTGEGTTFSFTLPATDADVGVPAHDGLPAL